MKDGGPAFPYVCDADFDYGTGMTLRDYFAAKAMQAMLGSPDNVATAMKNLNATQDQVADYLAAGAYHFADSMLKVREQ